MILNTLADIGLPMCLFGLLAVCALMNVVLGIAYDQDIRRHALHKHYMLAMIDMAKEKGGWRWVLIFSYFSMGSLAIAIGLLTHFGE